MKASETTCSVVSGLKDQIPNHKPCTQSNSTPEDSLRRTPSLSSTLQLTISLPDIRLRRIHVRDKLGNMFLLRSEVGDKRFLQRGDLKEGFLGVSKIDYISIALQQNKTNPNVKERTTNILDLPQRILIMPKHRIILLSKKLQLLRRKLRLDPRRIRLTQNRRIRRLERRIEGTSTRNPSSSSSPLRYRNRPLPPPIPTPSSLPRTNLIKHTLLLLPYPLNPLLNHPPLHTNSAFKPTPQEPKHALADRRYRPRALLCAYLLSGFTLVGTGAV